MKIKKQTIFLIVGLLLLAVSGLSLHDGGRSLSRRKARLLLWLTGSTAAAATVNVTVTYPEKLETGARI